jgi:hypothetical protein
MNNFTEYITPDRAYGQYLKANNGKSPFSLEDLRRMSSDNSKCQCGEKVWRMAGQGLCFSCTTGESDASEDYELVYIPRKGKRR